MYNKKVLQTVKKNLGKAKQPAKPKDIIYDSRGQWDHPGEVTRIPSNQITMQGVPYPVLAVTDRGQQQMMYPEQDYEFDADYVDEYPQMAKGGSAGCPPGHYYNGKECVLIPKGAKVITDPKEYEKRKAAYNDSLSLYNQSSVDKKWFKAQKPVTKDKAGNNIISGTNWNKYSRTMLPGVEAAYYRLQKLNKKAPTGKKTEFLVSAVMNGKDYLDPKYSNNTWFTNWKAPQQPIVLDKEYNYPTGYDEPIVIPVPPGKIQVGTKEIQTLDEKTGRVKTVIEPVYEDNPMPEKLSLLPPKLIDTSRGELQGELIEDNAPEYQMPNYEVERPDIYMRSHHSGQLIPHARPTLTTVRKPGMVSKALQKFTGYDPKYSEGYTDEEGNYIPGEFEKAQEEGRRVNFQGASSLRDLKAQKKYNKAYDEYEGKQQFAKALPYLAMGIKQDGGEPDYIELDLTPEEIDEYRKGGYIVEDISVPEINRYAKGGEKRKKKKKETTQEQQTTQEQEPGIVSKTPFQPGTYDPNEMAGSMVNLSAATKSAEAPMWVGFANEYEKKHSKQAFIDAKKKDYLKHNKGLNKAAGVNMENFPEKVLQNFANEYDYHKNNYVTKKLAKEKGFNPRNRGEWVEQLSPGERKTVENSRYGSKLQPSLIDRSLVGLAKMASPWSPELQQALAKGEITPGMTKKETKEINKANIKNLPLSKLSHYLPDINLPFAIPTGGLETFSATDIPGAWLANRLKNNAGLSTGANYKQMPIDDSELMPNVSPTDAMALNPLNIIAATELGVGAARLGYKGLKAGYKGAKATAKAAGKTYNKVATGNSRLTDFNFPAWKLEKPTGSMAGATENSRSYIAKTYTDRGAELLSKFGKGMNLTPEEWAEMEALTKSGATDFSKSDIPISRIPLYYNRSEQAVKEADAFNKLRLWQKFYTPSEKNIRTWSAGIPEGYSPERLARSKPNEKIRLVIPSRYTKDLGDNFAAMPYDDTRVDFIHADPSTYMRPYFNFNAAKENELMGNIPEGFMKIGSSNEGGYKNIIIKPIKKKINNQGNNPINLDPDIPKDIDPTNNLEQSIHKLLLMDSHTIDLTHSPTDPGGKSLIRFGDEPHPGGEFYYVDPEGYRGMPNWKEEGLKDANKSINDLMKNYYNPYVNPTNQLGNWQFKQFSPAWETQQEMQGLLSHGPQRVVTDTDFHSPSEFNKLLMDQLDYNMARDAFDQAYPEDPASMIFGKLTGDTSRDELFSNLYPNVSIPNFRNKFMTPEQEAYVSELLNYNQSVTNKGGLDKNGLKTFTDTWDKPSKDVLPNAYKDLLKKQNNFLSTAPAKDVVMEMKGGLGLKMEDIQKASPEQLEKWRNQIVKKSNKQSIDRWNKEVEKPYKGIDAYQTTTLNASDAEMEAHDLGLDATQLMKKEYESISKTIEDIRADKVHKWQTPEGQRRLQYMIDNTPGLKNAGVTPQSYVESIVGMTNKNKNYLDKLVELDKINDQLMSIDNDYDLGNIDRTDWMNQTIDLENKLTQKKEDLLKIRNDINYKGSYNAYMSSKFKHIESDLPPDKFLIGVGEANNPFDLKQIIQHEIGHLLQLKGKTVFDNALSKLELKPNDLFSNKLDPFSDHLSKGWDKFKSSPEYFSRSKNYFETGSEGQEKLPFALELRQDLLDKNLLKNEYDKITPELLQKHFNMYNKESNAEKTIPLRLYDIMENKKSNFKIISDVLNNAGMLIPGVVGAGLLMDKEKKGGAVNRSKLQKFIS